MRNINKFWIVIVILSCLMSGCGKEKQLPKENMDRILGASVEEAGEIFGIDFSQMQYETDDRTDFKKRIYSPEESFLLGDNQVKLVFYFLENEYDNEPIGLVTVQLKFLEGDAGKVAEYITETYGLKEPSLAYFPDDEDRVKGAGWQEDELFQENPELYAEAQEVYKEAIGGTMLRTSWILDMNTNLAGELKLYVSGVEAAIVRHIQETKE